ncbi:hypothetical protein ACFQ3N_17955 [Virgibacillus byunsanensis]|uniref:Uncharacterized protein n=1 Tax=Virgibacillus byunsanensis TaxID=570945 RepID=A0ABW3LPG5_9BACI
MSDVMKQVVSEILQGNKTLVAKGNHEPQHKESDTALNNINRPNYQNMKKDQRLSYAGKNVRISSNDRKPHERKKSVSLLPKPFNEESISTLHSRSLAQGNVPKKSNPNLGAKKARIIGNTKNGGCVWFFPQLPMDLMGSFNRSLNSVSVGVVKMPESLPSYIVLINEIIRNNQDVKFHITWNKEGDTPFTAELYDEDANRLEKIMNDIYQKINRTSLKRYETYTAVSPSSWLSKQMKIKPSADAIAFLEGVPYYTGIVLMDTLLRNFENNDFNFEINHNYILLEGNYHVISKLIAELKKEAARLVN